MLTLEISPFQRITYIDGGQIIFVSHSGAGWNLIFESLIDTYHKLTKLGFTYYNGKVGIIESSEEDYE